MQNKLQMPVRNEANEIARRRLLSRAAEPLFVADWDRALFIHYEVHRIALQREVPFPLDLREGKAYVSLVAFSLRDFRLKVGGQLGRSLFKPISNHEFLNVRTYVRHQNEPGIFFLQEWLSNPLCVWLGPRTFGLPYRLGDFDYRHQHEAGTLRGSLAATGSESRYSYEASIAKDSAFDVCACESLDEFLLERYTAYTAHKKKRRLFRIWHEPWPQVPVTLSIATDELLTKTFGWFRNANFVGANYSTGARNVWMGRPHRIAPPEKARNRLATWFQMP